MLLYCPIIVELWDKVNKWLIEIGFINFRFTDYKKILGDIDNGIIITTIILLTKKVIYNCFKKDSIPTIQYIQNETKKKIYQEKYEFYIKHKSHVFDKKWFLLNTYYSNN